MYSPLSAEGSPDCARRPNRLGSAIRLAAARERRAGPGSHSPRPACRKLPSHVLLMARQNGAEPDDAEQLIPAPSSSAEQERCFHLPRQDADRKTLER